MNENDDYNDIDEINEINTNTNSVSDKNKNSKLNIYTYISTINEKSTIYDDNILNNTEIPSSNATHYIQPSPQIFSSPINKLEQIDEINEQSERPSNITNKEEDKPIIDKLNDKIIDQFNYKVEGISIIPINTLKDNDLSPDCNLGLSILPSSLLSGLMGVNQNMVLQPLLNIRKSCFRRLSVEEIMTWQKSEITDSLLKMEDGLDKQTSLQMFRNLLSYMKDRDSSKKPLSHASKFLKMIKQCSPIIKDEAYLQVYKQLHNNKKRESLMRGWKFLAFLSCSFIPNNKDIYYLILNYLFFELQNIKDQPIEKHINYIFVHMVKTEKNERKNIPCSEELEYIESLKSIPVPIYFFNGKQTIVKVEPYTTFKEVKLNIMNMLDFSMQRAIFYSIYEICYKKDGTEERFIDDNEIVGDVLILWKSDIEKSKKKKETIFFRFYLKLLIYYSYDESNIDSLSIVYYQTLYDVISGKFLLEEIQILILAALQLVNEFGNDMEKAYIALKENYENYIPGNNISLMSKDQYIEKIIELYTMFSYYSQNECMVEYLKTLEGCSTYQTHLFDSKFNDEKSTDNEDYIPKKCILGFKPDGILVLTPEREKVTFYEYTAIKNWGISVNYFVISISYENQKLRRLYFNTGETNVIQTIMEIYGCFIAGLDLKKIQSIIDERGNKFASNTQTRRIATKYSRDTEYDFSNKRSTTFQNERTPSFTFPILPHDSSDEIDK